MRLSTRRASPVHSCRRRLNTSRRVLELGGSISNVAEERSGFLARSAETWRAEFDASGRQNVEHKVIAEEQGGLDPVTVQRMIAGRPVTFEDPRQTLVYELGQALVEPRRVSQGLFRRATALLGDPAVVDVAILIGWFTMVAMTLSAFDVPEAASATAPVDR